MLDIVYYVASTLDGYIARSDGSIDWLTAFEGSAEDYGYGAFYDSVDAVLIGSRTYEQVLTFGSWPYAGKPTWVFSRRHLVAADSAVVVTDLAPEEVAAELRQRGLRRAWLVGGGALAGAFQAAGLISEYIVSVMPIVLGFGIPLLGGRGSFDRLRLLESRQYLDGVLQVRYRPVNSSRPEGS